MMRRIQSFVRRDGRMTDAQRGAFDNLFSVFGLDISSGVANFETIFSRQSETFLEIGFGSGYSLLEIAKQNPQQNFIGIETHLPGVGNLLLGMEREKVSNIRIFYADAVQVFEKCILDESLSGIQIFFPDPWPKRKHHKRRLIQPDFVSMLTTKLKKNGILHLATDWEDYAKQMMRVLSENKSFENLAGHQQFSERSSQRPVVTKFEQRGLKSDRKIWELQFQKRHPE
jgi:tRNA (guanine-N7-)-methyltransferase